MIDVRVINNEVKTETSTTIFSKSTSEKLADAVGVMKALKNKFSNYEFLLKNINSNH